MDSPRGVNPRFAFRPSDCHNWIPQGEVRRGAGGRRLRRRPTKACPPREEVTRRRSRLVKDGYRYAGVPPISSWVMIANGQQPTDSLSAGDSVKSSRSSGAAASQSQRAPFDGLTTDRSRRRGRRPITNGKLTARWQYPAAYRPVNGPGGFGTGRKVGSPASAHRATLQPKGAPPRRGMPASAHRSLSTRPPRNGGR